MPPKRSISDIAGDIQNMVNKIGMKKDLRKKFTDLCRELKKHEPKPEPGKHIE